MNPMMMNMLNKVLGEGRAQQLLAQFNSMTPEQQQAEFQKVSAMTPEQRNQYLATKGTSVESISQQVNVPTNTNGTNGGRFNY